MSEWFETELKNLTVKIGSGATPRGGQEAYKSEGISLIRSQNILDFSFSNNGLAFIDDEQARQLQNVELKEKDVLINITGDSVARVCMVPDEILPARVNQHVAILRTDTKKLDPDYLLYYLLNPVVKRHLLRISSDGATRNALTKSNLEELVITAPKDVRDQKDIASKLKLIDSKISLLRQQNQTLEELAHTLFKRWFVDFEFPFDFTQGKPDEKGKPYKSSGGKMVESELGEIPEGWGVQKLTEIADYMNGLACQKFPPQNHDDKLPVLKIRELSSGITENTDFASKTVPSKYIIKNGDIIFSWSGTLVLKVWDGEDCVLNQHLFKVTSSQYPDWFIYQWTLKHLQNFISIAASKATTMGHIKRSHLDESLCLVPDENTFEKIDSSMQSMIGSLRNNNKEIKSLIGLRDTLLPKLMSGELTINEL